MAGKKKKSCLAETLSSRIVRVPLRLAATELLDSEFNTVLLSSDEDTTCSFVRCSVGHYLPAVGSGLRIPGWNVHCIQRTFVFVTGENKLLSNFLIFSVTLNTHLSQIIII